MRVYLIYYIIYITAIMIKFKRNYPINPIIDTICCDAMLCFDSKSQYLVSEAPKTGYHPILRQICAVDKVTVSGAGRAEGAFLSV